MSDLVHDLILTHELIWIDLETTALIPSKGLLLEWAIVLADDAPGGTYEPISQYTSVIGYGASVLVEAMSSADPYVQNMHTKNGLWDACSDPDAPSLAECSDAICALLRDLAGPPNRELRLAGASVHFDLAWIRHHMPAVAEYLNHRVFDVSTLTHAARIQGPGFEGSPREGHRALDDILASINDARRLRDLMWGAP